MKAAPQYWLMKSEPDEFSIDDLAKQGVASWTGVRNYQARNFMKAMRVGDQVLFYHSSVEPPGVAGIAEVAALAHPDATQFDRKGDYFEPRATKDKPVWECVDVRHVRTFRRFVSLETLRASPALRGMLLLKPGQRLSVQPVAPAHFAVVLALGEE